MNGLIELLENIKARPLMYLGEYNFDRLNCLLTGIHLGYVITNEVSDYSKSHKIVLSKRGWNPSSTLVHKDMEKNGLTEKEIVIELLEIEVETWKCIINKISN